MLKIGLISFFMVVPLMSFASVPPQVIGSYWALVVGIDKYTHWPVLNNAINDVDALSELLMEKYGFEENKIIRIVNQQATEENIYAAFSSLHTKLKRNDSLLIYYAGHGHLDKFELAHWVPYNAKQKDVSSLISTQRINHMISKLPAKHIFLVSDSCYSGGFIKHRGSPFNQLSEDRYFIENILRNSRQVLTSGGVELVVDSGKQGHSVFAYYFLKELQLSNDRYLPASLLSANVEKIVARNAKQEPHWSRLDNAGDEDGEFFFINAKGVSLSKMPDTGQINLSTDTKVADNAYFRPYYFDVKLNSSQFLHGESAKFEIKSFVDMQILIVNQTSNGRASIIFPNKQDKNNIIFANKKVEIPPEQSLYEFALEATQGVKSESEAFLVYGLPITEKLSGIDWVNYFSEGNSMEMSKFYNRLKDLSTPWLSQKILPFSLRADVN